MEGRKRLGTRPRTPTRRQAETTDAHDAAKRVLCQLIEAYDGRLPGKIRLYKAFYAAHLFYWNTGIGTLTTYPIVRMPMGPGIDNSKNLLDELMADGYIKIGEQYNGPHKENVYELVKPYPFSDSDPSTEATREAIQKAVLWTKDKTAAELSEETHAYSRSWREGKDGEELDIYIDVLSEEDYEHMQARRANAEALINDVFGA